MKDSVIADIPFTKMQAVGNDFVLIDEERAADRDASELALRICDRHLGVGADGLLIVRPVAADTVEMRMFNPDGTADFCGNGIRCVARYALDRGIVDGSPLTVLTLSGPRTATLDSSGPDGAPRIRVDMGSPAFEPAAIPMAIDAPSAIDFELPLAQGPLRVTALSTGTTHTIVFTPELPGDERFTSLGPQIENHPLFPERTSVIWCRMAAPDRIETRIWERGVGETLGCGTGACAAVVAAVVHGRSAAGEPVAVRSRGGELTIRWTPGEAILMTGPAEYVFHGHLV
jgi:diaminopimelate epimerase